MKRLIVLVVLVMLAVGWMQTPTASAAPYVSYSWNVQGPYYTIGGLVWDVYLNWVYVDTTNCNTVMSTNGTGGSGGNSSACSYSQRYMGWGYQGQYFAADFYSGSTRLDSGICYAGSTC